VILLAAVPTLRWAFEQRDPLTDPFLGWWKATFGFQVAPCLIVLWALAFGLVLYVFRCRAPRLYGAVEVAVGVFIALALTGRLIKEPFMYGPDPVFFTIVAALYVIVRGLDNFHKPPDGPRRPTILWDTGRFSTERKG
jgi:hypothetical protein